MGTKFRRQRVMGSADCYCVGPFMDTPTFPPSAPPQDSASPTFPNRERMTKAVSVGEVFTFRPLKEWFECLNNLHLSMVMSCGFQGCSCPLFWGSCTLSAHLTGVPQRFWPRDAWDSLVQGRTTLLLNFSCSTQICSGTVPCPVLSCRTTSRASSRAQCSGQLSV